MRIISKQLSEDDFNPFEVSGVDPQEQDRLKQYHLMLRSQLQGANIQTLSARCSVFMVYSLDELRAQDAQGCEVQLSSDQHMQIEDFLISLCVLLFECSDGDFHGRMRWRIQEDVMQMSYQEDIKTELLPLEP